MKNLQLDCMTRNPTLQIFSISTDVLTNVVGNSLHCEANCIESGTKTNLPLIARKQRDLLQILWRLEFAKQNDSLICRRRRCSSNVKVNKQVWDPKQMTNLPGSEGFFIFYFFNLMQ
jgi:hypothetical protein